MVYKPKKPECDQCHQIEQTKEESLRVPKHPNHDHSHEKLTSVPNLERDHSMRQERHSKKYKASESGGEPGSEKMRAYRISFVKKPVSQNIRK